jgi:hypothetical protein
VPVVVVIIDSCAGAVEEGRVVVVGESGTLMFAVVALVEFVASVVFVVASVDLIKLAADTDDDDVVVVLLVVVECVNRGERVMDSAPAISQSMDGMGGGVVSIVGSYLTLVS